MSRKIFQCVFFPTLGLPQVLLQEPCLFLNSLSHSREKQKPRSCGQLGQHLYFGGANPSSLLANAIAKFSLPKTPSLCVRGLLRGGGGLSIFVYLACPSSFSQRSGVYGTDNNLLSSPLHEVVFSAKQ